MKKILTLIILSLFFSNRKRKNPFSDQMELETIARALEISTTAVQKLATTHDSPPTVPETVVEENTQ